MKLPTKKKAINSNVLSYTVLLYGPTKIGKTTFVSNAPAPLFLCTEPGTEALSVYELKINTWSDFLQACKLLKEAAKKGEVHYDCVCIDTIDNLFTSCVAHVCNTLNIRHPSDADYGKGWDSCKTEFKRELLALARLPYGLWLISHAKTEKVKDEDGKNEYDRSTPTLPNSARKIVLGLSDMVLFCDFDGFGSEQRRVIRTKPTSTYDAGDRTGRLPPVIELNYDKFMGAFSKALQVK